MIIDSPIVTGSFLAREEITGSNGLITQDLTVLGTLYAQVDGTSSYAYTASYVEYEDVANKPTLLSSSIQIAADVSGSFTAVSESLALRLTVATASIEFNSASIAALQYFSTSLDNNYATDVELNTSSSTLQTNIDNVSASLALSITQATSSIADLTAKTLVSSSIQIASDISGSFTSLSESIALRFTDDEASISSLNAASSSYLKNTTDTLTGDLTVTGRITAEEFHTEFVSSSIIYRSGSTKFGDSLDDVHQFTGSVFISGSGTFRNTGPAYFLEGNVGIGTASPVAKLDVRAGSGYIRLGSFNDDYHVKIEQGDQLNFRNGANPAVGYIQYTGPGDTLIGRNLYVQANSSGGSSGVVRINSDGNVGIGTTTPTAKLHVDGTDVTAGEPVASFYGPSGSAHFNSETAALTIQGYDADLNLNITSSGNYANLTELRFQVDGNTKQRLYTHRVTGNTYLENATTGSMYFRNNGTYNMFISSSGAVGIGTTSPINDVSGLHIAVASSTDQLYLERTSSGTGRWWLGTASDSLYFHDDVASSTRMMIDSSGNVGIGTTSPVTKLTLEGVKNTSILTLRSTTNDASWAVGDRIGGIDFYSNDGSGAGAGVKASISYESISSTSATNHMVFRVANTAAGTNNQEAMRIANSGNVGIGTTTPGVALDVSGSIKSFGVEGSPYGELQLQDSSYTITGGSYIGDLRHIAPRHRFYHESTSTILAQFDSGTSYVMNSNVGIGTTSPGLPLEVSSNATSAEMLRLRYNASFYTDYGSNNLNFTGTSQTYSIKNNGSTAIYINSNSNIGIGTTNPAAKLQVTDTANALQMRIGDLYAGLSPYVRWQGKNAANTTNRYADIELDAENGIFTLRAPNTSSPTFDAINIIQGGNVGIGTTSPGAPFHVNDESATTVFIISRGGSDLSASTGIAQINFQADYSGSPINYGNIYAYANNVSGVRSSLDFNVKSTSGNILTGMTVYGTNSGVNVGIGTTSPGTKLHVNKTTVATKYIDSYSTAVIEDTEARLQLVASNGGSNAAAITLSNEANHWSIHHRGTNVGNYLGIGYVNTTSTTDIVNSAMANIIPLAIQTDGNVGIGTTAPNTTLDVRTSSVSNVASFYSTGTTSNIFIGDTTLTSNYSLAMWNSNSGTGQIWKAGTGYTSWGGAGAFNIYNSAGPIALHPNGTANVMFLSTGGSVGIGTNAPASKLEIYASGSTVLDVQGSQGQLLSVDDDLSGTIFTVSDISGIPILSVEDTGIVEIDGNLGIGTATPTEALVVAGNIANSGDSRGIYWTAGTTNTQNTIVVGEQNNYGVGFRWDSAQELQFDGFWNSNVKSSRNRDLGSIAVDNRIWTFKDTVRVTGDITAYYSSDERLKDNKKPIENATDKLKQIGGYEFDWIPKDGIHRNEGHDIGVIAQEVEKVLPEVVTTRDNGYKAVKYEKLVALLIQSNKELISQNEQMLERIQALESKLK